MRALILCKSEVTDHTIGKILLKEEFTRTLFFNFQRTLETTEIKKIYSVISQQFNQSNQVTFQRMSHRRGFHGAIYFVRWKQIG